MSGGRETWDRREFVTCLTIAGTAGLVGVRPVQVAAEPPAEMTRLRLTQTPAICLVPQYVAAELLPGEGFSDVQYVQTTGGGGSTVALAKGDADLSMAFSGPILLSIDRGDPITVLAGVHVGCFELFATDRVRTIRDLKGKTVAVRELGSGAHVFLAAMAAYVGLNPRQDIRWVTHSFTDSVQLLSAGKVDAFLGFPPEPQELRERQIGHVVVNSTLDRPWSQYFCCVVAANRDFVRRYPVAAKRALRAILKASSICAVDPTRAAQLLVDKGLTPRYDYALRTIKDLPYGKWREYDSEDTIRFYALRLNEAGMIISSPQKILAQGTDWRFLNELKKELKG
jgi:NitT/TauT family transport system substrate-binding protein